MTGRMIWGVLFIAFGVLAFVDQLGVLPGGAWNYVWPLALIAVGAAVLLRSGRHQQMSQAEPRLDAAQTFERQAPVISDAAGGGI
jgi:membrane protein implicated in regulation of membrane protease activity